MNGIGNGPEFQSLDAVQRWAFELLLSHGEPASPRGIATRERLAQVFSLARPRDRIIRAPARRWSLPLAIGEFCWHTSASNDVEALAYYSPRWREFSSDGRIISGSCYGRRIFMPLTHGQSRWDAIVALLRADPATRRAVIDLAGEEQFIPASADVSCVTSFQVFVRDGQLHAIVHMRSNDVVWGLPYDVFLFTMLQEMLAVTLGLDLGVYVHVAGSLHLYERHVSLAKRVLAEAVPLTHLMPVMPSLSGLNDFLAAERAIRLGLRTLPLEPYWAELAGVLRKFALSRSPASEVTLT